MAFNGRSGNWGRRRRALSLLLAVVAGSLSTVIAEPASAAPVGGVLGGSLSTLSPLLTAGGTSGAVGWGDNSIGQLGNGTTQKSYVPVATVGLNEVAAVSAGQFHSLALLKNGTVMAWGNNEAGELGNGTTTASDVPVQVSGLSEVAAVAAGEQESFALLKNSTVMAWGYNNSGNLGDGTYLGPETCSPTATCSRIPVVVSGLRDVVAIATSGRHTLALLKSGKVMAWGMNSAGDLGTGKLESSDVPVATGLSEVTAIAAGGAHSLAVLKSGAVKAWGFNKEGQLGDGTKVGPETCINWGPCSTTPITVNTLSEATAVSAGQDFSLALLKSGAVEAWGENNKGQLGDGTTSGSDLPVPVSGIGEASAVAGGGSHALVQLKSGAAMSWGNNEAGELGTGTATSSDVPVHVEGLSEVTDIAAGTYHSLAIGTLAPLPAVTSVEPNHGAAAGGTSVKVTGTLLGGATAVKFGSTNAASFKVESETSLTAVSPAGSGTVDVTVTTPAGASPIGQADQFRYSPTVAAVEPNHGPPAGGTSVKVTGTNLGGATAVKFGSTNAASFNVESETSLTAVSPVGSGTVNATVTTPGGTSPAGAGDLFSYVPVLLPTITKIEPNNGSPAGGTAVTITGTNFTGATAVKFGATNATSFTVNSGTSITAVSPAGTGSVDVTVTTPEGTSSGSAELFSYGPTVTKVEPNSGPAAGGTPVTITGTNFTGATAVKFGATNAASFTVNSASSITAVSPAGTGEVDVTVTTPGGINCTCNADRFTYGTTVTRVEPNGGTTAGGTSVTITGTSFTGATAVKFGATNAASFTVNSASSITAASPAGTGTVDVTVTTPERTSATSPSDHFSYEPSGPPFYVNGTLAGASKRDVVQFGTITMKSPFWGTIECHVLVGAPVWNETERGAASIEGWEPYGCKMPECLKGTSFISAETAVKLITRENTLKELVPEAKRGESSLPWPAHTVTTPEATTALKMGNTEKLPAQPVKFLVNCPGEGFEVPYEGTLQPHMINGTKNGLKPSHLVFESSEKTGFLKTPDICGGECSMADLTVEGEVTMLGTASQQLVTAE